MPAAANGANVDAFVSRMRGDMIRITRRQGLRLMLGVSQAALLGCSAFVDQSQVRSPAKPSSIAHGHTGGIGIQIPPFAYQRITDHVPAGAMWWDPSNGDDGQDGTTRVNAKKTFAAVEALVGPGGTIVVAGGTHALSAAITPTKSGSSGKYITLRAEPETDVVLLREADFKGAMERTWTWTLVDPSRQIWESPALGISDGQTIVNNDKGRGKVSNAVAGFIRIPNGAHGRPHLMRLMWYDVAGNYVANAFTAPNSGPDAGRYIKNGGYGGPGLYLPGNGKIRIRMQKVSSAYSGSEWPSDGRLGTCVDANGLWQEPISENPNDYEIHLTRFKGDYGTRGPTLFEMNGQSWWHIKGINGALMNKAVNLPTGSERNWFQNCTWYPQWCGVDFAGTTRNNKFSYCMMLSGDNRHLSWREHKTSNYWWQHGRSVMMRSHNPNSDTGVGTVFEDCTFFGWFDMALMDVVADGVVMLDHCAVLNVVDDGFQQWRTDGHLAFDAYYCYFAGGPWWSGEKNFGAGSRTWFWHHCVMDNRIPMLWTPLAEPSGHKKGILPNMSYPIHSGGSDGPVVVKKLYYCTMIHSPDSTAGDELVILGTNPQNNAVPAGFAHEVFNNIVVVMDNQRYSHSSGDPAAFRLSCKRADAGIHRYDYNCYWRDVPRPVDNLFKEIQDTRKVNRESFASVNAFRASRKYALSASMYSDGTTGHEQHGVEEDPRFVNLGARDYRPTSPGTTNGAKNLTSTGWPGTAIFENWKGALDPSGDGSEVGPR
jgi:hypothetical protein